MTVSYRRPLLGAGAACGARISEISSGTGQPSMLRKQNRNSASEERCGRGKGPGMSNLTNLEKRQFKRVLQMGGGYVLDFSNRTFAEFVTDSVGRDIYDTRYAYGSRSKANLMRGF